VTRADLVGLTALVPVVLFLRDPKEKVWGVLLSLDSGGVVVRGLDLQAFEDWLRQETRGEERLISPTTIFYPMHRVERVERDESVGPIAGLAQRFVAEVGRDLLEAVGIPPQA
jgi:hypothetical protein